MLSKGREATTGILKGTNAKRITANVSSRCGGEEGSGDKPITVLFVQSSDGNRRRYYIAVDASLMHHVRRCQISSFLVGHYRPVPAGGGSEGNLDRIGQRAPPADPNRVTSNFIIIGTESNQMEIAFY